MAADGKALHELARSLAVVMHHGQCRKGTGEPYLNHVERVAGSVQGWRRRTIAYLHDVIEDTPLTERDLAHIGFPEDIISCVSALTKKEGEQYRDFIERAANHPDPDVLPVKLADVRDNLRDIDILPGDAGDLRRRYITAEAILLEAGGS